MISRIRLRNWKAYSEADIELSPGVNFFIARNGIGKTSLMQAIAWGVFGDQNVDFDPLDAIRGHTDRAEVEIDVSTRTRGIATIARSVSRTDKSLDVGVTVEGSTHAGQQAVDDLIAQEVGADPALVARLAVLPEGSLSASSKQAIGRDLMAHLSDVFGVADLREAASVARAAHRSAERATKGFREQESADSGLRAVLETNKLDLEEQLSRLKERLSVQEELVKSLESEYDKARAWLSYRKAEADLGESLKIAKERVRTIISVEDVTIRELAEAINSAERSARGSLSKVSEETAGLRAKKEAIEEFVGQLTGESADCPLCLRAISSEEAAHAANKHADALDLIDREILAHSNAAESAQQAVDHVEEVRQELALLVQPTPPDFEELPIEEAQSKLDGARGLVKELTTNVISAENEIAGVGGRLEALDALDEETRQAQRAYRAEAISDLALQALERSADAIVSDRIQPLLGQIEDRWKAFWGGSHGLMLDSSGTVSLRRGERSIPWEQMSGGERVVGLLMIRLVAIAMTTRGRFLLLDEPLEHLDPRNRRMVASMLVKAAEGEQFDQLLVTTYEEPVARRLADTSDHASIVYLTADQRT